MFWYWSLLALVLAVVLISTVGVLARYYIGKRIIEWLDLAMMNVPLLNKFYGAIKQVERGVRGQQKIPSRRSCWWNFRAKVHVFRRLSPPASSAPEVQQKTRGESRRGFHPYHTKSDLRLSRAVGARGQGGRSWT